MECAAVKTFRHDRSFQSSLLRLSFEVAIPALLLALLLTLETATVVGIGGLLESLAIGENLGPLLGLLVSLSVVCRRTVEEAATDYGVHGNRLVDVGVVRGTVLEGRGFGQHAGTCRL